MCPPPIAPPEGFQSTGRETAYCEHEPRAQEAWEKCGLHPRFIKPILDVANIYNIIILIRANDPRYIELLTEHYTTKSMLMHSKTCSWGPMTGFVCFNPAFHKSPTSDLKQSQFQLHGLAESLSHTDPAHRLKTLSPLHITDQRLQELLTKNIIRIVKHTRSATEETYQVVAREPAGQRPLLACEQHAFLLKKQLGMTQMLWRVQYMGLAQQFFITPIDFISPPVVSSKMPLDILEEVRTFAMHLSGFDARIEKFTAGFDALRNKIIDYQASGHIQPQDVLTLVDPRSPYPEMDYRCATTGDYDLFAFHPLLAHFAAQISSLSPEYSHASRGAYRRDVHPLPPWIFNPASTKIYPASATISRDVLRRRSRTTLSHSALEEDSPTGHQDVVGVAGSPKTAVDFRARISPQWSATQATGSPALPAEISPSSSPLFSPALQGMMSNRELDLIAELNHRIQYGGTDQTFHSLRLFHHGPDSRNPHGHKPDLPCTALIPCAMHSDASGARCFRAIYIDSVAKLEDFYFWNVICAGYALCPGINPKWFADDASAQAVIVCDPVTEIYTSTPLNRAHRIFLNGHIKFEESLASQHAALLSMSAQIWLNSVPPDVRATLQARDELLVRSTTPGPRGRGVS